MENKMNLKGKLRLIAGTLVSGAILSLSPAMAQHVEAPQFRSRAEQLTARRNLEKAYPEVMRALRTLRLSSDKMIEAESKLRRSEAASRAAREELQSLDDENARQGYNREARSARADELRGSLKQSTDQLHSEIKTLLTPQQRDQFDQRVQKLTRHNPKKRNEVVLIL
jgi:Spy/CpxP family protein refolding chaperone